MRADFWDKRYGGPESAYGDGPNEFLSEILGRLPRGPALCLGAGEGRNAVFVARHVGPTTAVDLSAVGLAKASERARAEGVEVTTVVADLNEFEFGGGWQVITSIWAHTPPEVRARVHAQVVAALAPGAAFVLESYSPDQVGRGTGGPPDPSFMTTAKELKEQLSGLDFAIVRELERDVHEGAHHNGRSAVVQMLAFKPT